MSCGRRVRAGAWLHDTPRVAGCAAQGGDFPSRDAASRPRRDSTGPQFRQGTGISRWVGA